MVVGAGSSIFSHAARTVAVFFPKVSLKKDSKMANELPHSDDPPGVFQLFNEHRTFFFDSDISSLPNPPQSIAVTPRTAENVYAPGSLSRRQTMPSLTIYGSGASSSLAMEVVQNSSTQMSQEGSQPHISSAMPMDNIHIPSAIMTPTTISSYRPSSADPSGKNHYQTGPSYGSNQILKSFKHEFHFFGQQRRRHGSGGSEPVLATASKRVEENEGSVSCPPSPRRESSPDLTEQTYPDQTKGVQRSHSHQDLRKLSLVQEASLEQEAGMAGFGDSSQNLALAKPSDMGQEEGQRSKKAKRGLLASQAGVKMDTSMAGGKDMPLTRKVMEWLTTPQAQPNRHMNKTELNAMSPSSF